MDVAKIHHPGQRAAGTLILTASFPDFATVQVAETGESFRATKLDGKWRDDQKPPHEVRPPANG